MHAKTFANTATATAARMATKAGVTAALACVWFDPGCVILEPDTPEHGAGQP